MKKLALVLGLALTLALTLGMAPQVLAEAPLPTVDPAVQAPDLDLDLISEEDGSCEQPAADLFPGAEQKLLAACTTTTTCGSWQFNGCGCDGGVRVGLKRTCESWCCDSSGNCLYSGPYTQTQCSQLTC